MWTAPWLKSRNSIHVSLESEDDLIGHLHPSAPLSTALDQMGHATLAIDLLISPEMDLLNDTYFEKTVAFMCFGHCGLLWSESSMQ